MRPAEIKKRAMDPLYSERLLEEALSDISENAHARKLQHVEPHPGRGTTTRRAAIRFVVLKSSKISFERRRPPIGGSRFKNSTNFSDCNNKMTFFAKKLSFRFFRGFQLVESALCAGSPQPSRAKDCTQTFVLRWLRTAGMGREGECADRSRPFDSAIAPLKVTECCHSERSRRRSRGISTVGRA